MQHRSGRQQRRGIVRVHIVEMPVKQEAGAAQHFRFAVGVNGFEALGLAAIVHMRLERQQPRRLDQRHVGIGAHIRFMRADVNFIHADREGSNHVLRHIPLRIELQPQRDIGGSLGAAGMKMELKVDLGSSLDEAAGAVAEDVAAFSDCVLIEEDALLADFERHVAVQLSAVARTGFRLDNRGADVVNDGSALGRNDLDTLDVAVLRQAGIDQNIGPPVRALGLDDHVLGQADDEIGFADLPDLLVAKLARRRQVGRVALRSAGVHPLDHRGDLLLAQRNIITEMLDADVLVDEPRRHLAREDLLPDRPRPGSRLFVSEQRHRRYLPGAMTDLAMRLEDPGDVLGKRNGILGAGAGDRTKEHRSSRGKDGEASHGTTPSRETRYHSLIFKGLSLPGWTQPPLADWKRASANHHVLAGPFTQRRIPRERYGISLAAPESIRSEHDAGSNHNRTRPPGTEQKTPFRRARATRPRIGNRDAYEAGPWRGVVQRPWTAAR